MEREPIYTWVKVLLITQLPSYKIIWVSPTKVVTLHITDMKGYYVVGHHVGALQLRDRPLENLWGGAGEVQKKNSRKGKLNEKKFLHANKP